MQLPRLTFFHVVDGGEQPNATTKKKQSSDHSSDLDNLLSRPSTQFIATIRPKEFDSFLSFDQATKWRPLSHANHPSSALCRNWITRGLPPRMTRILRAAALKPVPRSNLPSRRNSESSRPKAFWNNTIDMPPSEERDASRLEKHSVTAMIALYDIKLFWKAQSLVAVLLEKLLGCGMDMESNSAGDWQYCSATLAAIPPFLDHPQKSRKMYE